MIKELPTGEGAIQVDMLGKSIPGRKKSQDPKDRSMPKMCEAISFYVSRKVSDRRVVKEER